MTTTQTEQNESTLRITTNHHWYPLLGGYELTQKEIKEFDYLDDEEQMSPRFFRYRGTVYDTDEFMSIHDHTRPAMASADPMAKWDGYQSDSYFSGIVVRYNRECDAVQVGKYFS